MHGYYASKLMISKIVKHIEILHTFRLAMSYLAGRSNEGGGEQAKPLNFYKLSEVYSNCKFT